MNAELPKLPPNWKWATMGEIADVIGGGTPRTTDLSNYESGTVPWITPADLSGYTDKYISQGARFITKKGLDSSSAKLMPAGTVLFSSRAPVGYVAIASNPVCTNQGFKSFVLKNGVLPDYVYWWLKGSKALAEGMSSGTTFLELSGAKAKQLPIPIAPIEEQASIVAEIEKQLSRLDEAVSNLKRVKANLKRYKVAVLKAAVEGRLVETEAELARREGRAYETGTQFLLRIRETRSSQVKSTRKGQEPIGVDTSALSQLPEGWTWTTLGTLLTNIEAGRSFKCEERPPLGAEVGVVKVSSVTWGEFDEGESKTCLEARNINEERFIRPGDFLFSRANTIDLVGACVIARRVTKRVMLSDKILRFRLVGGLDGWVLCVLRSEFGRREIERLATGNQESMRNIGQERIRAIRIPLPPTNECTRIVEEIERRLSIVADGNSCIGDQLRGSNLLRQHILTTAFLGSSNRRLIGAMEHHRGV